MDDLAHLSIPRDGGLPGMQDPHHDGISSALYRSTSMPNDAYPHPSGAGPMRHYPGMNMPPSMQHANTHESRQYHGMPTMPPAYGGPEPPGRGYPGFPPSMAMPSHPYPGGYLENQGRQYQQGMGIPDPPSMGRNYPGFHMSERSFSMPGAGPAERQPPGYNSPWYGMGPPDAGPTSRHSQYPGLSGPPVPPANLGPSYNSPKSHDTFNPPSLSKSLDLFSGISSISTSHSEASSALDKMTSVFSPDTLSHSNANRLPPVPAYQPQASPHPAQNTVPPPPTPLAQHSTPHPPTQQPTQPPQQQDPWSLTESSDLFSPNSTANTSNHDIVTHSAAPSITQEKPHRTSSHYPTHNPSLGPPTPGGQLMGPSTPGGQMMGPSTPGGQMMGPSTPGGQMMGPSTPGGQMMGPSTPGGPIIEPSTPAGPTLGPSTPGGPIMGPSTPGGPIIGPSTPLPSDNSTIVPMNNDPGRQGVHVHQDSPFPSDLTDEQVKDLPDFGPSPSKRSLLRSEPPSLKDCPPADDYLNPLEQMSSMDPSKAFQPQIQEFNLSHNDASSNPDLLSTLANSHNSPLPQTSITSTHITAQSNQLHTSGSTLRSRDLSNDLSRDLSSQLHTSSGSSLHVPTLDNSTHLQGNNSGLNNSSMTSSSMSNAPMSNTSMSSTSLLRNGLSASESDLAQPSMNSPHMNVGNLGHPSPNSPHLKPQPADTHLHSPGIHLHTHSSPLPGGDTLGGSTEALASHGTSHSNHIASLGGNATLSDILNSPNSSRLTSLKSTLPDSTRQPNSDSLPPDISASLFTSTDHTDKALSVDTSSPPFLTKHDGPTPSLDQIFSSPDGAGVGGPEPLEESDDFSSILGDTFGSLAGDRNDLDDKLDHNDLLMAGMGGVEIPNKKRRGPRPRMRDSGMAFFDDKNKNRGRPKARRDSKDYNSKIKKPRGRPPKDPQKMAMYLAAKAGMEEPNAEVMHAAVIACEAAEKKAQDPTAPKRKRKMKNKLMDSNEDLARLTWDYKDELEMGLNPSKRAMGTGSSDYLNFMTSASSDLFEPEKAPASSTTELLQESYMSDGDSCGSVTDMDSEIEQSEIVALGEDVKDFSSTIAKHASLAEAVARAGRIHQTLATDIENEDASSAESQLLQSVGLSSVSRQAQITFLSKMGLQRMEGGGVGGERTPQQYIRQLALAATDTSKVDTVTRLLDRYLNGTEGISYTSNNANTITDPMLLLLLLQQVTGMLACCMYKSRQNTNDIEDFNVLSRSLHDQKTEQFMCRICMQAFKNMNRYKSHLLKHFGLMHAITVVHSSTPNRQDGIEGAEVSGSYSCDLCAMAFPTCIELAKHAASHMDSCYTCSMCTQIFENRHSYLSHVDTHRDNERRLVYECPVCHKTDRSEDVLTGHIQTVHLTSEQTGQNVGAQDCEICGEAFSSRSKLKHHYMKHTNYRPYSCAQCRKSYSSARQLRIHYIIHSKERNHRCALCSKAYYYRCQLNEHMSVHTNNDKMFKCEFCDRSFVTQSRLMKHRKSHHHGGGMGGHQLSQSSLRGHPQRDGHPSRPPNPQGDVFRCDMCVQQYSSMAGLEYHMKHDHVEVLLGKNFANVTPQQQPHVSCPICLKRFTHRTLMEAHYTYMHANNQQPGPSLNQNPQGQNPQGQNPQGQNSQYSCSYCSKIFLHENQLNIHKEQMHCSMGMTRPPFHTSPGSQSGSTSNLPSLSYHSCKVCRHVCESEHELRMHMSEHHMMGQTSSERRNERRLNCTHCTQTFSCERERQKHVMDVHKPLECEVCFSMFPNKHSLSQHQVVAHGMDISLESNHSSPGATRGYPTSPRGFPTSPRGFPTSPRNPHQVAPLPNTTPGSDGNFLPPRSQSAQNLHHSDIDFDNFVSTNIAPHSDGIKFEAGSYGSCSDDDTDAYEDQRFDHDSSMEAFQHPGSGGPKWQDGRLDQMFGGSSGNVSLGSSNLAANIASKSRVLSDEERKRKLDSIVARVGGLGRSSSGPALSSTPKSESLGRLSEANPAMSRSGNNLSGCFDDADATMSSLSQLLEQAGPKPQQFPGRSAMPKLEAYLSAPSNVPLHPSTTDEKDQAVFGPETKPDSSPTTNALDGFEALMDDSNQSLPALIKPEAIQMDSKESPASGGEASDKKMIMTCPEHVATPDSLPDMFNPREESEPVNMLTENENNKSSNDRDVGKSPGSCDAGVLVNKPPHMLDKLSDGIADRCSNASNEHSQESMELHRTGNDDRGMSVEGKGSSHSRRNSPNQMDSEMVGPGLCDDVVSMKSDKLTEMNLLEHNKLMAKEIKNSNYSDISDMSDKEDEICDKKDVQLTCDSKDVSARNIDNGDCDDNELCDDDMCARSSMPRGEKPSTHGGEKPSIHVGDKLVLDLSTEKGNASRTLVEDEDRGMSINGQADSQDN